MEGMLLWVSGNWVCLWMTLYSPCFNFNKKHSELGFVFTLVLTGPLDITEVQRRMKLMSNCCLGFFPALCVMQKTPLVLSSPEEPREMSMSLSIC